MNDYLPHGACIMWDQELILLMVAGNALTFFAYLAIPAQLFWGLRNVQRLLRPEERRVVILFALFVGMCGAGHAIRTANLWLGRYWLEAWWDLGTGAVSIATAGVLGAVIRRVEVLVS